MSGYIQEVKYIMNEIQPGLVKKVVDSFYTKVTRALGFGLFIVVIGGAVLGVCVWAIIFSIYWAIVTFVNYPIPSGLFSLAWFTVSAWLYWDERSAGPVTTWLPVGEEESLKNSDVQPEKKGNNGESQ